MQGIREIIESAWENRARLSPSSTDAGVREAVDAALARLDRGELRVAEKIDGEWQVRWRGVVQPLPLCRDRRRVDERVTDMFDDDGRDPVVFSECVHSSPEPRDQSREPISIGSESSRDRTA